MSKSKTQLSPLPQTISPADFHHHEWHDKVMKTCIVWYKDRAVRFVEALPRGGWRLFHYDETAQDYEMLADVPPDTLLQVEEIGDMRTIREASIDLAINWIMSKSDADIPNVYAWLMGEAARPV